MSPSEYRSQMKDTIRFAEGVMRLKGIFDAADDTEKRIAQREREHAEAVAHYEQEIADYLSKVQDAQALHAKAVAELDKRHAEFDRAQAELDKAYEEAKDQHTKQMDTLRAITHSTVVALNQEKADAMKALTDAKTLHAAEMAAMGAERAKLDADLTKLKEVRHKLLVQLQTGV